MHIQTGPIGEPRRFGASLRSIASGGEAVGENIIEWGREAFGRKPHVALTPPATAPE